jgi:hypothetical protein
MMMMKRSRNRKASNPLLGINPPQKKESPHLANFPPPQLLHTT